MSRSRTRARKRLAHLQDACTEFQRKREDPEAFAAHLRRLAESNHRVWAIARLASRDEPLDEEESAMIAQTVAPHLAAMTPYYIRSCPDLAK